MGRTVYKVIIGIVVIILSIILARYDMVQSNVKNYDTFSIIFQVSSTHKASLSCFSHKALHICCIFIVF